MIDATRSFLAALPLLARCVVTTDHWECWEWQGPRTWNGYGLASQHPQQRTHRVLYQLVHGPVAPALVLHHFCENKLCANPSHIEALTRTQHVRLHGLVGAAADHAARETCLKGHPFDEFTSGQRRCSICRREYMRECMRARRAKQRGAA